MNILLHQQTLRAFQRKVLSFYRIHGRDLPWRRTHDPYAILVSEIMLQQTQVDRVIPQYHQFLQSFPTIASLANAPLRDVLTVWQGLGYNRRPRLLKEAAVVVHTQLHNELPREVVALEALPSIGPYTARAVATFAYNQPHTMIETNIRAVYLHEFFPDQLRVHDRKLVPVIEATLRRRNPRQWYSALMDFGAHLKKQHPNPSQRSQSYHTQSTFKNSNRAIRGDIIKILVARSSTSLPQLVRALPYEPQRIATNLTQLIEEKMVSVRNNRYSIA